MTNTLRSDSQLWLRLVARLNPDIWEVVGGGPQGPGGIRTRAAIAALNPQPLPPKEIGAAVLHGFAMRAFLTRDFARFMDDIDDWCPTPPRPHIPVPKGGDDPVPQPNWEQFLGAAVAAVELAHGFEGEGADQLSKAANQLFEMSQQA